MEQDAVQRCVARCLAALMVSAALAGCLPGGGFHRSAGQTMGTEYAVAWSGGADCAPGLARLIEAELQSVNAQMSTYLRESEISRFNRAPAGEWVPVSAELAAVVALALDLSQQSGGAFDITVGPLVRLWGFGAEARDGLPAAPEIEAAAARVGYRRLSVRMAPPALYKRHPGLRLDLSAIGKGHGVDRLARLLESRGCDDYLVDIGGEVRARGSNRHGEPWRIGIETPGGDAAGAVEAVLRLSAGAVATSGDYRNFRLVGETRLSHTIDPRTGWPVAHDMASVTVVADSTALADGLATLINVLGPGAGMAFAERRGIAALALVRRDGGFEQRYTRAMRGYLDNLL